MQSAGDRRTHPAVRTMLAQRLIAIIRTSSPALAITAAAAHQVMLTLPAIVRGNQQTTAHMAEDVADSPLRQSPDWGVPDAPGLGVDVDEERLQQAAARYAAARAVPAVPARRAVRALEGVRGESMSGDSEPFTIREATA
jgi:hypothetical protein